MIKKILLALITFTLISQSLKVQAQSGAALLMDIQTHTSDSLTVERADGQKIVVVWPYRKNIHKAVAWEQLLDDFQFDFKKVSDDIPAYDYYHVNYLQKKELVVNEVVGRQTYTVNEQDGINYVKSNLCVLKGDKLDITIEFTDHQELLDPSLKQDLQKAIAQVKNKFYISAMSPERHLFDTKNNKMLPYPKRDYKFFVPTGVQLGLLRNNPYIEMRAGLGLIVDKRAYIALQYDVMSQYNSLRRNTEFDQYIGLSSGSLPYGFGSEVGLLVKNGISGYSDFGLRAGINFRTKGGVLMSAQYYVGGNEGSDEGSIDFGFSIGYGF